MTTIITSNFLDKNIAHTLLRQRLNDKRNLNVLFANGSLCIKNWLGFIGIGTMQC